jgi:hypothetical protein
MLAFDIFLSRDDNPFSCSRTVLRVLGFAARKARDSGRSRFPIRDGCNRGERVPSGTAGQPWASQWKVKGAESSEPQSFPAADHRDGSHHRVQRFLIIHEWGGPQPCGYPRVRGTFVEVDITSNRANAHSNSEAGAQGYFDLPVSPLRRCGSRESFLQASVRAGGSGCAEDESPRWTPITERSPEVPELTEEPLSASGAQRGEHNPPIGRERPS